MVDGIAAFVPLKTIGGVVAAFGVAAFGKDNHDRLHEGSSREGGVQAVSVLRRGSGELRRERDEAVAALEPFAGAATEEFPDDHWFSEPITEGDLRAARDTYIKLKGLKPC